MKEELGRCPNRLEFDPRTAHDKSLCVDVNVSGSAGVLLLMSARLRLAASTGNLVSSGGDEATSFEAFFEAEAGTLFMGIAVLVLGIAWELPGALGHEPFRLSTDRLAPSGPSGQS
jgi:hypothetical protein